MGSGNSNIMQQLNSSLTSLCIISSEAVELCLKCDFNIELDWQIVQNELPDWLVKHGMTIKETIIGADRIAWRLFESQIERFTFHFEDLSEAAWFEFETLDALAHFTHGTLVNLSTPVPV